MMDFKKYSDIMRLIGNIEGAAMAIDSDARGFIMETASTIADMIDDEMKTKHLSERCEVNEQTRSNQATSSHQGGISHII